MYVFEISHFFLISGPPALLNCTPLRRYTGHRDGIWEVSLFIFSIIFCLHFQLFFVYIILKSFFCLHFRCQCPEWDYQF